MNKRTLLSIFLAAAMMTAVGCTSKNVEGEGAEANELTDGATDAVAEEGASFEDEFGEGGEVAAGEAGAADGAEAATDDFGGEEATDDFGGDVATDDFGDEGTGEVAQGGDAATSETADDLLALEDDLGSDTSGTTDPLADSGISDLGTTDSAGDSGFSNDELSGLSDTSSTDTSSDSSYGSTDDSGYSEAPVGIPLRKMLTTPYTKNGVLVNTIYIARDGDTLSSIAQKIYGSDRSEDLRSINGHLASRDVKVGDKVYYNSPNRPNDNSQIITYYEDLNLQPEIYPAQAGENIRSIGKKLLGHENSWKEIWATNMEVESKDALPSEVSLRFWPGSGAPSAPPAPMTQATTETSAPPPPAATDPTFDQPPPLPEEVAQTPPPPPEFEQPGAVEPPPPEIAPPPIVSNEPPPSTPPAMAGAEEGSGSLLDDPDQTMALAAGIILLTAALALIIIIRKKRRASRGIDFHTATHTQIE